jgi:hypothetical protein
MKSSLRIALLVSLSFLLSSLVSAQGTQVGNVYVGICDGALQNTMQNEIDVYTAQGQFLTAFHGPVQNACMNGMTFNASGHLHIISARFGTQAWDVLEFDNLGSLVASPGPFSAPTSVTHDRDGNLYLSENSILKIDTHGNTAPYAVVGNAQAITLAPDQHTIYYSAANGDIKSFDVATQRQGPDIAVNAAARSVRALPDNSILTDTLGAIQHWIPKCSGCPYKQVFSYQVPANADSFTLDPDGVSFWTINTFYDNQNQLGKATVYRTSIKTGAALGSFSLQPLTNGRYYSMSIGVNGDSSNSTATATASLTFPKRLVGTLSGALKAVVTNTGPVEMVVSSVAITGDFAIKRNGCSKGILPGGFCNISVTFTPTQTGTRSGTLKVFDSASNSPQTVALSGIGQ